jgi:hypothetical protein
MEGLTMNRKLQKDNLKAWTVQSVYRLGYGLTTGV